MCCGYETPQPDYVNFSHCISLYYQSLQYPHATIPMHAMTPIQVSQSHGKDDALIPPNKHYLPIFKDETYLASKKKSCTLLQKQLKEKNKKLLQAMDEAITRRIDEQNCIACCGKTFKAYKELCKHFQENHYTNNLACPYPHCSAKAFSHRTKLVDHYLESHCCENIFLCIFNQCRKKYKNRGSLLVHVKKCVYASSNNDSKQPDNDESLFEGADSIDTTLTSSGYNFFDKIDELVAEAETVYNEPMDQDLVLAYTGHTTDIVPENFKPVMRADREALADTTDRKQLIKNIDIVLDNRLSALLLHCCNQQPFKTRKELLVHFEKYHLHQGQFVCPFQNCVHHYISDSQTIVDHYLIHENPYFYICPIDNCFYTATSRKKLIEHVHGCLSKNHTY